jgi:uroporphyrinogen-III synthase
MMSAVVLFKSPEEDSDVDPYANALSELNLHAFFIPVLRHTSVNDDELRKIVIGRLHTRYGGVIATSSRAAEMWVHAIGEVIGYGSGQ